MKRLLHSPIAKAPTYASAQYKCDRCGREIVLLGKSSHRAMLRTPKCDTLPMTQTFFKDGIKEPPGAMLEKLEESKLSWINVNTVPGDRSKHKERVPGRSPELQENQGFAALTPAQALDYMNGDGEYELGALDALDAPDVSPLDVGLSSTDDRRHSRRTDHTNRDSPIETQNGRRSITRNGERLPLSEAIMRPLRDGETLADALTESMQAGMRNLRRDRE